jgi:hypothetical protein
MADREILVRLKAQGQRARNSWRAHNPRIHVNLRRANPSRTGSRWVTFSPSAATTQRGTHEGT